ncbi:type IV pilus modification protein PilV [Shewanella avicenniae]|uniref:type IV pilus modification protein PilV n=1 Tax=Shewanella avicenniae TaxID=2814294 RepID=UPI001E4EDB7D|nr:type IV pilus modification protein PilV [Shewanella avicenniae]
MSKVKRAGFSLIEVMVALVILVIGLIGIFNLHIVAKRSSFESFQQTTAAFLANDILHRMKLNKTELANYAGTYGPLASGDTEPTVCDVSGASCSSADMRIWDIYQWRWLFSGDAELTSSSTSVGGLDSTSACITVGTDRNVTIAIAWKGIQETAGTSINDSTCGTSLGKKRRLFVLTSVIEQG